jgi:hypothetical protein
MDSKIVRRKLQWPLAGDARLSVPGRHVNGKARQAI